MQPAAAPLDWQLEGHDWPHCERSHFVDAGGLRWHLQRWEGPGAEAPGVLLLHGTGASTHSWRHLAPLLAERFSVLAVDLPGHAFTSCPPRSGMSLPGMAAAVSALLKVLGLQPEVCIGHSAGAAIAVQMALLGQAPAQIVAINGAFLPFGGPAATLLSPLARLLHASPWVPELFARRANEPGVVRRLVEGTGSVLDEEGLALYARLIRNPAHARSALGMMAHWDLRDLQRQLPALPLQLDLLVGAGDRAVPPRQARRVKQRRPQTRLLVMPGLGHLAHEEAPAEVARRLLDWILRSAGRP